MQMNRRPVFNFRNIRLMLLLFRDLMNYLEYIHDILRYSVQLKRGTKSYNLKVFFFLSNKPSDKHFFLHKF